MKTNRMLLPVQISHRLRGFGGKDAINVGEFVILTKSHGLRSHRRQFRTPPMLTAVMRVTNVRSGLSFQRLFVSCNSNKRRIDGNFQVPVIEREPFGGGPSRS
jgi:hypothetical protein